MKKILLGLFLISILVIGYNVQATEEIKDTELNVCCESYGVGSMGVKTPSTYSMVPKDKCLVVIPGGGRNIVNESFCKKIINSNIPVISGVKGPQALKVGQKGEWELKASAPMGGSLTYEVIWGDEVLQTNDSVATATKQAFQQKATFTHVYNKAGTYNPKFTVSSENTIRCVTTPCPSNSESVNTSLSVRITDLVVEPKEDKGCLPGYKFSYKTGEICPTEIINNGCLKDYKFSPITGIACLQVVDDKKDEKKTCTEPGSNCGVRNYGISRVLKHGTKGDDVKTLQSILNLIQDGVFGPETKTKLIEWQKEHGLTADGVLGPKSLEKIETEIELED